MSKAPEQIPTKNLAEMERMLRQCVDDLSAFRNTLENEGLDSFSMEGWPTLLRGLMFFQDQSKKLVGQTAKSFHFNFEDLKLDHQTISPIKKTSKAAQRKSSVKAANRKLDARRNNKQS